MYKIGIIGHAADVLCFSPLGFTVFESENAENAGTVLKNAVKSGEYAVLFITEDLAADLGEEIDRYKNDPLPAITVIPGRDGGKGYGLANIKKAVERAVGADILK
ncbi:MAG: V-type ATP synthase subunit F [Clostridia bacterium]|nr:V-type ATP synthase subunit F [Clostridia bacterium]